MINTVLTIFLALSLGQGAQPAPSSPDQEVLELALSGYQRAVDEGVIEAGALLTIIDYSLPSTETRLFIYDPTQGEVLHTDLVAHGKNTGANHARHFANVQGSLCSSLGFFATGETYQGKHGYTLRLNGLEAGINDNAMMRHIVIHGADYVSKDFIDRHGRLGRSWGCPALPQATAHEVIDLIKGGTCVFVYSDDSTYLTGSKYIVSHK